MNFFSIKKWAFIGLLLLISFISLLLINQDLSPVFAGEVRVSKFGDLLKTSKKRTPRPTATTTPTATQIATPPQQQVKPSATATSTPTPTLSPTGQITKKVLVLDFDPLINGTTPLHIYKSWTDPFVLQQQYVTDVKEASYQYVNYQIVNTQVIRDYPVKKGGLKFTQDQYLACLTNTTLPGCMEWLDYNKLITDYNLCGQVDNGTIDEVWLWGGPYFGYYEAAMAGPGAFFINGEVITGTTCQKKLPIMGFNYERTVVEMVHDLAHRAENVMIQIFGAWQVNTNTAWNRFSIYNKQIPDKAACGNSHFPPNGISDYDYANQNTVVSYCEDWLNYPSTTARMTGLNCSGWLCNTTSPSKYFEKWWLSHFPHAVGTTNNKLNNWWAYIVDFDNAIASAAGQPERWYAIENGANDGNTSCVSNFNSNEVYFGVNPNCSPSTNYTAKFSFPDIRIDRNSVITEAYIEFIGDGPYNNVITENITITDGTTTSGTLQWTISEPWIYQQKIKLPSLEGIVNGVISNPNWTPGKTLTVNFNHVSGTGERRVFAVEREPLASAKLVLQVSPAPTKSYCWDFKDQNGVSYKDNIPFTLSRNSTYVFTPTYVGTPTTAPYSAVMAGSNTYFNMFNYSGTLMTSTFTNPYPGNFTIKTLNAQTTDYTYFVISDRPNYCKSYVNFEVK